MNPDDIHDRWAERTGAYSPAYYAHYGPNETSELLGAIIDRVVGPDAAVLELGCSSGRHLAHLHDHGYDDLHGVDINESAFEVMERVYPDLAATGAFTHGSLEEFVRDHEANRFDVVYAVQTLQHLPPEAEWVFDELVRLTDSLLVTAETDSDESTADAASSTDDISDSGSAVTDVRDVDGVPLYVRDWSRVFADRGWVELEDEAAVLDYHTFRAFRPPAE
ncbi:class I SAM-dependent methyltransferase [Natronococcus sp. A-GB1]|uniref:class I SAM-dependent methyltransferase n=1 Tax=Natronococcus sp. A-GB1 TaxID=3037648 RepID=UPI00241E6FA5|nr:class I SAM-dependent methyltransferase [Natronococcus sp. A-GB1]MDG5762043.1 class I SAM-dependent methyltransferase [Natronococcus sp. A-GB1]